MDYSEPAVKLAQGLAEKRDVDPAIFSVADLLESAFAAAHAGAFDLLLDKGTYDAISLSAEPAHRRRFIETAATIVKPKTGRFLITSCNWTQDELIAHFQPGRHRSRRCGPIESALTFSVRYTTLCLRQRSLIIRM